MAKILIVDDSKSFRMIMASVLSEMGHDSFHACDGIEALSEVRNQQFDAVVTDIHMPRMDGIELIQNLRKIPLFKAKPILVVTTEIDPAIQTAARKAGATGFGNKPLDRERFKNRIVRLLP